MKDRGMRRDMEKDMDQVIGAFEAVMSLGIGRIGPFVIALEEDRFSYWKAGEEKTVELSSGGRNMVVDMGQEMAAVRMDKKGMAINKAFTGSKNDDTYPIMNFSWIEGVLRSLTVDFPHDNSWGIVRSLQGEYEIWDECSDYFRKYYGGQIPLTIREGSSIMGRKIPLSIDTEKELEKIIQESDIEELNQAIREFRDRDSLAR